jgi:L-iditol 2-dehydrogenase
MTEREDVAMAQSAPTMIRAARLHGARDIRVADERAPVTAPGEALVRVTAVGICGSDIHWYIDGRLGTSHPTAPFILGHEFIAEIAEGRRAGERVVGDPNLSCGTCRWCSGGQAHLCPYGRFAGHAPTDGAMATVLAWPENRLHPIPDSVDDAAGVLLEPLCIALHALDLGKVAHTSRVAVHGCGPIGLLIIRLARDAGATTVLAIEPLAHRRTAAERIGATAVVASAVEAVEAGLVDEIGDCDVTFEVAGTDEALADTLALTMPGGKVIVVGIPEQDRTSFQASLARRKGLSMKLQRRSSGEIERAIDIAASGRTALADLITHRFVLDEARAAFEVAARREGLKVVITP